MAAPITLAATEGGFFAQKCHGKSCGFMGYFAVALMFLVLCGGVFMLLQSNFGVLQGYLISGTAFWASWLVLALIWFAGVPGVPIDKLPGIDKPIPLSTPRFNGPQGTAEHWISATGIAIDESKFLRVAGTQRDQDIDHVKAAETAAVSEISKHYADELGVAKETITVPGTVLIDTQATEIIRTGGGASPIKYVKFTTKPATAGSTATDEERANIAKIKPASFTLSLDKGDLAWPTYIALPLTFILFALHLLGLMWYERRDRPAAVAPREREREAANA
ncbi:MAG: hypothetical protein ABIM89_02940 [Mycobacteriales bacterium]